jgi:hypothetical protein
MKLYNIPFCYLHLVASALQLHFYSLLLFFYPSNFHSFFHSGCKKLLSCPIQFGRGEEYLPWFLYCTTQHGVQSLLNTSKYGTSFPLRPRTPSASLSGIKQYPFKNVGSSRIYSFSILMAHIAAGCPSFFQPPARPIFVAPNFWHCLLILSVKPRRSWEPYSSVAEAIISKFLLSLHVFSLTFPLLLPYAH